MNKAILMATLIMATVASAAAQVTVHVAAPTSGSTVGNPVRVAASATSGARVSAIGVYVDNVRIHTEYAASMDRTFTLATGTRGLVIKAWDTTGASGRRDLTVNVGGTSSGSTTSGGVTITSPGNNATVGSPTRLTANAVSTTGRPITAMGVYVDGNRVHTVYTNSVDTNLTLNGGTRNIVVQSWDSAGTVNRAAISVNVGTVTTSSSSLPAGFRQTDRIEEMTGWEHCDRCAGEGGSGPQTSYSMKHGVSSPSLDGNSTEFWLGASVQYANALWWKQLTPDDNARFFTYELYFYMTNPQVSQALEFDVNQSIWLDKYIFGTECDIKGTKTWRVWDPEAVRWISTGVHCAMPQAYRWHHLVWEFERTWDKKVRYIAFTLNGQKTYINRYYNRHIIPSPAREINVAVQIDGDGSRTPYSMWVDRITLKHWH